MFNSLTSSWITNSCKKCPLNPQVAMFCISCNSGWKLQVMVWVMKVWVAVENSGSKQCMTNVAQPESESYHSVLCLMIKPVGIKVLFPISDKRLPKEPLRNPFCSKPWVDWGQTMFPASQWLWFQISCFPIYISIPQRVVRKVCLGHSLLGSYYKKFG